MEPLICSFYTAGTGYEAEAAKLRDSCEALGLPSCIKAMPNQGNWGANCHMKPSFIRACLERETAGPVLWVDSDAIIRQNPCAELAALDGRFDFAAHFREARNDELLSGTLWFAQSPASLQLLKDWQACNVRAGHGVWDQKNLQQAMSLVCGLTYCRLPPEYTFIFDSMRKEFPGVRPIIEHFQASRRLRGEVGR